MSSIISNQRIIKNSLILYFRMFFLMVVSLYTVRIVLRELGVVDYGIFNVVGSIVAMGSFLTGSLTAASNRFFSMEVVKDGRGELNKIFCLNITVYLVIFLALVILLETVGLWYLEHKLTLPSERLGAARWVYQFSILSLGLSFLQVPYISLITTHERMRAYAYISIIEGIMKLVIAYTLTCNFGDKLELYAVLMFSLMLINTLCFYGYCRLNFEESRFCFYWDKLLFIRILDFSGVYFLGSTSVVVKSYGINLLINFFFSPAVNAARGIACQVESAVLRLSDGFFTATRPQLYKAYSLGEYENLFQLICRTTIITVFLMSLLAFPFFFNANLVLSLWLGEVPAYTVAFLDLTLIEAILNSSSSSIILTILATGKQKVYQIFEFLLRVVALPVCYVVLLLGYAPETTVIVCIICSGCAVLMRAVVLQKVFGYFMLRNYLFLLVRIVLVSLVVYILIRMIAQMMHPGILYLMTTSILSVFLLIVSYGWCVMSKSDRIKIMFLIKSKILVR